MPPFHKVWLMFNLEHHWALSLGRRWAACRWAEGCCLVVPGCGDRIFPQWLEGSLVRAMGKTTLGQEQVGIWSEGLR